MSDPTPTLTPAQERALGYLSDLSRGYRYTRRHASFAVLVRLGLAEWQERDCWVAITPLGRRWLAEHGHG